MTNTINKYTVELWGSKPGTNDDCWTGNDYATLEEANEAFENPADVNFGTDLENAAYLVLSRTVGPITEVLDERKNPFFRPYGDERDQCEWQSEIANEAGMAFGCDGYNDAMGY